MKNPSSHLVSVPNEKPVPEEQVRKGLSLIRDFHYYYSVFSEQGVQTVHFNVHS
jgi:hypothetical protein